MNLPASFAAFVHRFGPIVVAVCDLIAVIDDTVVALIGKETP